MCCVLLNNIGDGFFIMLICLMLLNDKGKLKLLLFVWCFILFWKSLFNWLCILGRFGVLKLLEVYVLGVVFMMLCKLLMLSVFIVCVDSDVIVLGVLVVFKLLLKMFLSVLLLGFSVFKFCWFLVILIILIFVVCWV